MTGRSQVAPLTSVAYVDVCCHVQGQGIARQRQAIVNGLRDSVMVSNLIIKPSAVLCSVCPRLWCALICCAGSTENTDILKTL